MYTDQMQFDVIYPEEMQKPVLNIVITQTNIIMIKNNFSFNKITFYGHIRGNRTCTLCIVVSSQNGIFYANIAEGISKNEQEELSYL